jgi:hypothetical protein
MKYFLTALISVTTSIVVLVLFVNYYPLFRGETTLGIGELSDITGGDTVSNFPAVYTANNTTIENAINTIDRS